MRRVIYLVVLGSLLLSGGAFAGKEQAPSSGPCKSVLLVSSWFENNVKIFDGCTGNYVRNLNEPGEIKGPQSVIELPDGDVLVVSEENHSLVVYDRETLSEATVVLSNDNEQFMQKPVGAVFDGEHTLYVASYSQNSVKAVDIRSWEVTKTILPPENGLIKGADSGMTIFNHILLIPGYDSDNVVAVNLDTLSAAVMVEGNTGGLDAARWTFTQDDDLFVSSEKSNAILQFDAHSGAFKANYVEVPSPVSLVADGPAHWLVTSRRAVYRIDRQAKSVQELVSPKSNHLKGATGIARISATL